MTIGKHIKKQKQFIISLRNYYNEENFIKPCQLFTGSPKSWIRSHPDSRDVLYTKQYIQTHNINVDLIKELDGMITYELPERLLGIIWKGKYKGQKQKWFIMKFIGNDSEINIKTKHPEFLDWKWIDPENLTDIAVHFKLEVYKKLKSEIKKILD